MTEAAVAKTDEAVELVEQIDQAAPEASEIMDEAHDKLTGMLETMKESGKAPVRVVRATERLVGAIEAAREGRLDLSAFLRKQPSAKDLTYPERHVHLVKVSTERLAKLKYSFPHPSLIAAALEALRPGNADNAEVNHRILHFLATARLSDDGFAVSSALRRLLEAARIAKGLPSAELRSEEQAKKVASATAGIESFLTEARNVR